MSERVVVDPITRIEGHLRIEAQMDGDRIAQAYVSVVCAHWYTGWHPFVRSRMHWITRYLRMRN